jgi:hypothetical protein
MTGERIGDSLYQLSVLADNSKHREDFAATAVSLASANLLHQRFAHANCRDVTRTINSKAVKDTHLDPGQNKTAKGCDGCMYGKMHRLPFPTKGRERAEKVGELVHGDVGIVNITTPDGCRFYSLLKDDYTECDEERERLRLVTVYWDDHCSVESRQRLRVRGGSPLLYMEPTGAVLPDGGIITRPFQRAKLTQHS